MPLRLKLFLGIAGFFTIALCFFGYIAYDTAVELNVEQEKVLLRDISARLSRELMQNSGTQPSETTVQTWLNQYKNPQIILMVSTADHRVLSGTENNSISKELQQQIANAESAGSVMQQEIAYAWYSTPIAGTQYNLSVIHKQDGRHGVAFMRSMAIPLFFAALIVIWVATWSAIYIAALLEKLNFQKNQLQHQAQHDSLTSLPNRVLMQDRMQVAMYAADRQKTELALMIVDLNRFKEINDTMGHHCGDLLLVEVGKRLSKTIRKSDSVARLGGDEFAIILNHVAGDDVKTIAEKLTQMMEEVMELEGNKLFISASIGVAVYPTQAKDMDTLFQYADAAMYAAKGSNLKWVAYNEDMEKYNREKLILTNELRSAVELGQLSLNYQPQVNIKTGAVIGTEALVRWNHPTLGFVPPDKFIPVAEQAGLIRPLTEFVLNTALQDLCRLEDMGYKISMAINFSAVSLQDKELESLLSRTTERWGVQSSKVILEITETAVMENTAHTMKVLQALDGRGFKISMDDFGTGYSSLVNLRRLPVQELKVDRTFVMNMLSNDEDATIVRTVIELGHSLGKKIVAEGVENEEVLQALSALGCDIAQGYYISRPVAFEALTHWLASNAANTQQAPVYSSPAITPQST